MSETNTTADNSAALGEVHDRPSRPRIFSLAVVFPVIAAFLLIWDFSEILFAAHHQTVAEEMIKPDARLTEIERDLNQARYSTLYRSADGEAPMLEVTTCRRIPYTLRIFETLFPGWDLPKQAISRGLARTQFTVVGTPTGTVKQIQTGPVTAVVPAASSW